jgi:HAMP domain-containing protein
MEMPVQVIVVLFVAVVVGGAVIMFSQRVLTNAQQGIVSIGQEDAQGVAIVTLGAGAAAGDVHKLAQSCLDKHPGELDVQDCFVVRGNVPSVASLHAVKLQPMARNITMNVSAASGASALFISYDPRGYVKISS